MIVEKDGVRYMHSRTRRIVKGFVYEGEDVWRLEGKKRIYVRSQRKGKLIAIEGHEEEFESYVSQKKLPPDEICQLVPTDPKYHPLKNKIKGKAPAAPGGAAAAVAHAVQDFRTPHLVQYPLWAVLMVIFMASVSGVLTAVQIAHYWAANRPKLEKIFGPEFPRRNISHDTIRRILMNLDASEEGKYLRHLFRTLLNLCFGMWRSRLLALDGQACRSSKNEKGCPHYTLSIVDCDLRITCDQVQVGEKTNEIPQGIEVLEWLDLNGSTVCGDAMHCQRNLVDAIIMKGGNYCLSLKSGAYGKIYESAQILADVVINDDLSEKPQHRIPFLKEETYDDGHGRVEKRAYYALPGSHLEGAEHWTGLHTGTLFVVDTEKTYKATKATGRQARTETNRRFFISSFPFFDNPYVIKQGIRAIRQRWGIESTHWEIDVQMRQDLVQMSNVMYIRAQRMLSRIGLGVISHMQMNFEKIYGTNRTCPSVESMMIYARDPEHLIKVFEELKDAGDLDDLLKAES